MHLLAENLSYAYRASEPVLHHVSLALHPGQVIFLLGRNGSGKTTLMSCLMHILKPTTGRVLLDGRPIADYTPAQRAQHIGLIPQIHIPAFAYNAQEMVLMGRAPYMGLFGAPGKKDYAIARRALNAVGMYDYAERPYTELSGGQRQLVMIARGLAQQCDILLMDEPDAHLDPNNRYRVLDIVKRLATQDKLTFVISSHDPNSALLYADRVLLLKAGKCRAFGTVAETLTETLLEDAYGMAVEVIHQDGQPRAIMPRRVPEQVWKGET